MSNHPAVIAMEAEVNKAKDEFERAESRRDKAIQEAKDKKENLGKLRRTLRTVIRQLEPERLKAQEAEEDEDSEDEKPEPVPEVPKSGGWYEVTENQYKRFREFIYAHKDEVLSIAQMREAMGYSKSSRSIVTAIVQVAIERGLVEEVGPHRPPGFKGGRLPIGYRYVASAPETGPIPGKGGDETARSLGGGPVPHTGSNNGFPKEVKEICAKALAQGASLHWAGNGHIHLKKDGKQTISIASTPGTLNAKKIKGDMRRHGYPVS